MDADVEVIARCRRGDPAAWIELYRRHAPTVARFLHRLAGSSADVDDLVQQVFVELVASLDRFRGDARFTTWLYGIASHVAGSHLRGESLWRRHKQEYAEWCAPDGGAGSDPAAVAQARAMLACTGRAVGALRFEHRVVWILHEMEGLGGEGIAAALGIPAATARVRLFRARREVVDALVREGFAADLGRRFECAAND
jgi:RNA polymerase sigma-70 factor (ECF subfamily)